MVLRLRQDIFDYHSAPLNSDNIQKTSSAVLITTDNKFVELKVPTKVPDKRKMCTEDEEKDQTVKEVKTIITAPKLKSSKDAGEWFNARTYLLNMANQAAKRPKLDEAALIPMKSTNMPDNKPADEASDKHVNITKLMATSTPTIKPTNIPTNNVVSNLKEKPKTSDEDLKFSDHMKDSVQTVCQICKSKETFVNMRVHTRKVHGITITEYKNEYGGLEDHMVEAVYHRCRLCEKVLLLESDAINTHMKGHKFNMKEYSNKYMTLKKQQDKKSPTSAKPKLSIDGKPTNMSAADLLDELQSLISKH